MTSKHASKAGSWGARMEVLKVSSKSNPNSCAGALAGVLRQDGAVEVQVVGAGALNQAVKAIAIARGYVAPSGIDLVCVPTFADIEIDGQSRTAIRILIEDRMRRQPDDFDGLPQSVSVDGQANGRTESTAGADGHAGARTDGRADGRTESTAAADGHAETKADGRADGQARPDGHADPDRVVVR